MKCTSILITDTLSILDDGIPVVHAELERYNRIKESPGDVLEFLFTHYKNYEQILYFTHEHTGWGGGIRVIYPKSFGNRNGYGNGGFG